MYNPVKEAFNRQSELFDAYEEKNEILKRMRRAVREHLLRHLRNGDCILELNAGTGMDAVFLAGKGFHVHAIDLSEGMLKKLEAKIILHSLQDNISFELLSFTELDKLHNKTFDYIFSNFGGLNCEDDLTKVIKHFRLLLKPGGTVTFVIMPPVCPWEIVLALKGKFSFAFRRLHGKGSMANIEGVKFRTYYHSLKKLKIAMGHEFRLIEAQGLAALSPPPYAVDFPDRHPALYKFLCVADERISHIYPFSRCADHYIATFKFLPHSNLRGRYWKLKD